MGVLVVLNTMSRSPRCEVPEMRNEAHGTISVAVVSQNQPSLSLLMYTLKTKISEGDDRELDELFLSEFCGPLVNA